MTITPRSSSPALRIRRTVPLTLLPLLWLVTVGCQAPSVTPFGEATAQVHAAVRLAYHTTLSRLDVYEAVEKDTGQPIQRAAREHPANRFTNHWALRLQVLDAMVSYSESLVHIVGAGDTSKANARAISEQAAKLVEATPWAVYGDAAKSIFQTVHGLAVSVAQYRSIAQAVNKADEVVQRSAEAIGQDMDSLGRMLGALHEDQEAGIIAKYNHHRAYVNAVRASRSAVEDKVLQQRQKVEEARLGLLEARLAENPRERLEDLAAKLQQKETNLKLVLAALQECDELRERVAAQERAFQSEMAASRELRRVSLDLVASTREAIRIWAAAHKDLRLAIAEKRQPNVQLLVSAALEIRETIQKMKNL
jgi:hypothetical protein